MLEIEFFPQLLHLIKYEIILRSLAPVGLSRVQMISFRNQRALNQLNTPRLLILISNPSRTQLSLSTGLLTLKSWRRAITQICQGRACLEVHVRLIDKLSLNSIRTLSEYERPQIAAEQEEGEKFHL